MTNERTIKASIDGRPYQITSDDNYLSHIKGEFEPKMVRLFKTLINPTDTVMDIGANIGCTALLFSDLGGRVIAFEPSPSTFKFLQDNVTNSGKKNIQALNVGLGESEGDFELTFDPQNRAGGFVSNNIQASDGHSKERIKIVRLDDLKDIGPVQFIKIDVEGFEGHSIRGGIQTIRANKPIVVLEANHWCLNAFQRTSLPDFCDQLRSEFPLLYAVDGVNYLDLNNSSDSYNFMYNNIVCNRFQNVVAAFSEVQVTRFLQQFVRGVPPAKTKGGNWLRRLGRSRSN